MIEAIFQDIINDPYLIVFASLVVVSLLLTVINRMSLIQLRKNYARDIQELQLDVQAMAKSSVGMGQKVLETERRLSDVLKKQFAILNSQPEHPSYDQATRLIAMGASQQDLVNSCGFSHAEAELLFSLNKHQGSDRKTLQ